MEGNKGVGMQWEQHGVDQQWLMFSVKRCNYPGRSRVSRLVGYVRDMVVKYGTKVVYEGFARYLDYYLVHFIAFKILAVSHTVFTI